MGGPNFDGHVAIQLLFRHPDNGSSPEKKLSKIPTFNCTVCTMHSAIRYKLCESQFGTHFGDQFEVYRGYWVNFYANDVQFCANEFTLNSMTIAISAFANPETKRTSSLVVTPVHHEVLDHRSRSS